LDLWLRIATQYPIIQLKEYTNIYNLHEEQYTFGDPTRHEKELKNFKYVFTKPELKNVLPQSQVRKHLAQSHYFISLKHKSFLKILKHSVSSFMNYPKGYNKNSNKTMFVNVLYSIPLIGLFFKKMVRIFK